mmetsp:Transcript_52285/g.156921  ORF Transcript_52285/g.156921 Transcript_52285/m.156921 type:complete len:101 (+) Transcript_52285:226-528(+)
MLFAVRRGRSVGRCVFFRWEDCVKQVEGYEGSQYQTFEVFGDAKRYVESFDECHGCPVGVLKETMTRNSVRSGTLTMDLQLSEHLRWLVMKWFERSGSWT